MAKCKGNITVSTKSPTSFRFSQFSLYLLDRLSSVRGLNSRISTLESIIATAAENSGLDLARERRAFDRHSDRQISKENAQ